MAGRATGTWKSVVEEVTLEGMYNGGVLDRTGERRMSRVQGRARKKGRCLASTESEYGLGGAAQESWCWGAWCREGWAVVVSAGSAAAWSDTREGETAVSASDSAASVGKYPVVAVVVLADDSDAGGGEQVGGGGGAGGNALTSDGTGPRGLARKLKRRRWSLSRAEKERSGRGQRRTVCSRYNTTLATVRVWITQWIYLFLNGY